MDQIFARASCIGINISLLLQELSKYTLSFIGWYGVVWIYGLLEIKQLFGPCEMMNQNSLWACSFMACPFHSSQQEMKASPLHLLNLGWVSNLVWLIEDERNDIVQL